MILDTQDRIPYIPSRNKGLLIQFSDTFQTTWQMESLEPLLTKDDREKVEMLKALVQKHVNVQEILRVGNGL